jgi:3-oxoacyl-[acyl-carrier-protein] synthase III (EC 2.3.1.41)
LHACRSTLEDPPIPLALDHYVQAGKIKPGDRIMAVGFGAGLSWGGILFEWG